MQLDKIAFFALLSIGCAELGLLNFAAVPALLRDRARVRSAAGGVESRAGIRRAPLAAAATSPPDASAPGVAPLAAVASATPSSAPAPLEGGLVPPSISSAVDARGAVPSASARVPSAAAATAGAPLLRIGFRSSSRMYTPEGRLAIFSLARKMRLDPTLRVRLVGHTDDVGTAEDNDRLSRERAEVVAAFLEVLEVNRSRMVLEGRGGREPLDTGGTSPGRAINRRVEAFVWSEGGTK